MLGADTRPDGEVRVRAAGVGMAQSIHSCSADDHNQPSVLFLRLFLNHPSVLFLRLFHNHPSVLFLRLFHNHPSVLFLRLFLNQPSVLFLRLFLCFCCTLFELYSYFHLVHVGSEPHKINR